MYKVFYCNCVFLDSYLIKLSLLSLTFNCIVTLLYLSSMRRLMKLFRHNLFPWEILYGIQAFLGTCRNFSSSSFLLLIFYKLSFNGNPYLFFYCTKLFSTYTFPIQWKVWRAKVPWLDNTISSYLAHPWNSWWIWTMLSQTDKRW